MKKLNLKMTESTLQNQRFEKLSDVELIMMKGGTTTSGSSFFTNYDKFVESARVDGVGGGMGGNTGVEPGRIRPIETPEMPEMPETPKTEVDKKLTPPDSLVLIPF